MKIMSPNQFKDWKIRQMVIQLFPTISSSYEAIEFKYIVGVDPMKEPSGDLFYFDYKYIRPKNK